MRAVVMVLAAGMFAGSAAAGEDLSLWQKRMPITFSGFNPPGGGALTNFPALVILSNTTAGAGFSYSDFLSPPYGDLRFADADKTTPLDFEIQCWDTNGLSLVWVRVPELTNNAIIYALWGKSGVAAPPCATNGAVWTNGFTGVWHLDETNGVTAHDAIRDTYPGVIGGSTAGIGAIGQLGRAFRFGGNDGYVTVNIVIGTSATISGWAAKTAGTSGMLWSRATYNPDLWFYNGTIYLNNGDSQANPFCVEPADSGRIHHYVTVIDATKAKAALYIDGRLASSAANYQNPSGTPLKISSGCGYDWSGVIDEFTIAAVPRSSNWVWASYVNIASNGVFNSYGDAKYQGGPWVTNAGAVSETSFMTLNGYLISTGMDANVSAAVFWGTNDAGRTAEGWTYTNRLPGVAPEGPLSINVTPDTAGKYYYFRFSASNSYGQAFANPAHSFIWWADIRTGSVFSTW